MKVKTLNNSEGRDFSLDMDINTIPELESQLMLIGISGLAYTPLWNEVAVKLNKLKAEEASKNDRLSIANNKLFTKKELQAFGEFAQAHERIRMVAFMDEMERIGGLIASHPIWVSFKDTLIKTTKGGQK